MKVRTYRDLEVWQVAYALCRQVYEASRGFPKEEVYGLTAQVRHAAISVPSNIAEGMGRRSTAEFIRSLRIAYGSNSELETQLLLARDLGYIAAEDYTRLEQGAASVERMLSALLVALQRRTQKRTEPAPTTGLPDHRRNMQ
ncbi:MAG TPA: four helix bundle protein [candidate division WOR-3 bacterium]|uniref:Four helix bundle protein n=1 Tax=candidate division WOR-3 bacterium TaxID=2052148 RepID=A0A7V0T7C7_UNCW3|nr:four helix bundle protein [candidate division WOR-3 bacterium]